MKKCEGCFHILCVRVCVCVREREREYWFGFGKEEIMIFTIIFHYVTHWVVSAGIRINLLVQLYMQVGEESSSRAF